MVHTRPLLCFDTFKTHQNLFPLRDSNNSWFFTEQKHLEKHVSEALFVTFLENDSFHETTITALKKYYGEIVYSQFKSLNQFYLFLSAFFPCFTNFNLNNEAH